MEILRAGSSGPAVAEVQAVLRALGLLTVQDGADADRTPTGPPGAAGATIGPR